MGVDDQMVWVWGLGDPEKQGEWFPACKFAEPLDRCIALAAEMKGCEAVVVIYCARHVGGRSFFDENLNGMSCLFRGFVVHACTSPLLQLRVTEALDRHRVQPARHV